MTKYLMKTSPKKHFHIKGFSLALILKCWKRPVCLLAILCYFCITGVLLDNYQISHYTETLFPDSKFKTDEIIKVESLSYGAVVNDTYLRKCFRRLIAEDKYLLYDFTRNELTKTLKVTITKLRGFFGPLTYLILVLFQINVVGIFFLGGFMIEWSAYRARNPDVVGSSLALTYHQTNIWIICFPVIPS